MIISLDMYQTLFAAVCVLMLGRFLKARIGFLEKFCRRGSSMWTGTPPAKPDSPEARRRAVQILLRAAR